MVPRRTALRSVSGTCFQSRVYLFADIGFSVQSSTSPTVSLSVLRPSSSRPSNKRLIASPLPCFLFVPFRTRDILRLTSMTFSSGTQSEHEEKTMGSGNHLNTWMAATRFYHIDSFPPPSSQPAVETTFSFSFFFAFAVVEWLTRLLCVLPGWDT